jgi:hypothetical protein
MKYVVALFCLFSLWSCHKNKNQYWLEGTITDELTGSAMSGTSVKVEVKKLMSGVYNDVLETAAQTNSDGSGHYETKWSRENIAVCKITASQTNYFDAIVEVSPDLLVPGEFYNKNLQMTPRADIDLHVGSNDATANVSVTFYSTDNYCNCDDLGTISITGIADTTLPCMASGGKWIKYLIQASGSGGTVNHWDSLYCNPFVHTPFTYIY